MNNYLIDKDKSVPPSKKKFNFKDFKHNTCCSLNNIECFLNNVTCCYKVFKLYRLLK